MLLPRKLSAAGLSLLLGLVLTGCASFATYPPDDGAMVGSRGDVEPIPTLMAEAARFGHQETGSTTTDYAVNLPPGTEPYIYEMVFERLGTGHPQRDSDELAIHVTKVRVRGFDANVDIYYPKGEGYQFTTLSFLVDPFRPIELVHIQPWLTSEIPPPPTYVERTQEDVLQLPLAVPASPPPDVP